LCCGATASLAFASEGRRGEPQACSFSTRSGHVARARVAFLAVLSALFLSAAAPLEAGSLAERYEAARRALDQVRANEAETRATRDRLAGEAETLRERLVANAARVQDLEAAAAVTTAEIARLKEEEAALDADLADDRQRVGALLAVLQRLDAVQPPALALRPDDSLAAARGSMILGTMLPPVYEQAAVLGRQLRALAATRASLEARNREAASQATALQNARVELARLLDTRTGEVATASGQLDQIQTVTDEVAREATDLKALIDRIASLREQGNPDQGMVVVTPGAGQGAALRRGSLLQPVVGTSVVGDPAGPGLTPGSRPQGLWFMTGGGAQAIAPADSEVVFSGPYQKFGQVLLLEIPGGYHLLLAGLDRIDVRIGDLVLAGEPVGVLPAGRSARLYLELRRDRQIVDPSPWMSDGLRKARG
jgi:septal ring factor EnvC (AmiA/AmiB activator)